MKDAESMLIEVEELLEDMAEYFLNGTAIHPGSDLAVNALTILKALRNR